MVEGGLEVVDLVVVTEEGNKIISSQRKPNNDPMYTTLPLIVLSQSYKIIPHLISAEQWMSSQLQHVYKILSIESLLFNQLHTWL